MLLGGTDTVDPIIVEEIHNGMGATSSAFNMRFPITSFQLHMRISKQATIESIVCCTVIHGSMDHSNLYASQIFF